MASSQQSQNLLLAELPSADFDLLRPSLHTIDMPVGLIFVRSGEIPRKAYFPHSGGIASCVSLTDGDVVEVRMTGREGAVGAAIGAGARASFTSAVVRFAGKASAIDQSDLSGCTNCPANAMMPFRRTRIN